MAYIDVFYNIVSFLQAAWYHITINQHLINNQQNQNSSSVNNNSSHNVNNNGTSNNNNNNNNINQQQQQQAPNLRPTPITINAKYYNYN
eukprot:UN01521